MSRLLLLLALAAAVGVAPALGRAGLRPRGVPRATARSAAGPPAAPSAGARGATAVVHEVVRGDTLSAIAQRYGVTVASIVIANRLRGARARLAPGQRLKIPRPGSARTPPGRRRPLDETLPAHLVLGVPELDEAPLFEWPVTGPITSTFGRRKRGWHRGLDIRAEAGTPVVAAAPGVVVASGVAARYGQRVMIEHEGGFATVYAHNARNLVEVGQTVVAGQVIAVVGRTGHATAEHLHFEIRYGGHVYNPLYLLPLPPRPVAVDLTLADQYDDE